MSNTVESRSKKQTPTGNLWEFCQKMGAETGNFIGKS